MLKLASFEVAFAENMEVVTLFFAAHGFEQLLGGVEDAVQALIFGVKKNGGLFRDCYCGCKRRG